MALVGNKGLMATIQDREIARGEVTEAYSGASGFSLAAVRSSWARCSSVLGGKNSKLIGVMRIAVTGRRRHHIFASR